MAIYLLYMDTPKQLFLFLVLLLFVFSSPAAAYTQGLKVGFYENTCPQAEAIVEKIIAQTISVAPSLAAPLLRMYFHDCFVKGCDGSVLLNSSNNEAEKNALPNLSLRGFQIIDKVKSALEIACPGVVSCADILAIVARDVVVAVKGPYWEVETGRRDGRVSNLTEAFQNLIPPFANIALLKSSFARKGLSVKDLVVLSGGHTIGTSRCLAFRDRLYNFSGKGDSDPTLDPNYVAKLKLKCKPGDENSIVEMDPGSFRTFDEKYYTLVSKRRGLFQSDAALLDDSETRAYVQSHAATTGVPSFFTDFGVSMVNMGRIEVLTGSLGEIRKQCSTVN